LFVQERVSGQGYSLRVAGRIWLRIHNATMPHAVLADRVRGGHDGSTNGRTGILRALRAEKPGERGERRVGNVVLDPLGVEFG
jgi:hypothetical protein